MNQKELKELIDYLIEKDIAEFELERGDIKIRIKRPQVVASSFGAASGAASGAGSGVVSYAAPQPSAPSPASSHSASAPSSRR